MPPFLTRILRFSTSGRPEALVACYVAAWPLPRLDSHQLAVDSFRTHHAELAGLRLSYGFSIILTSEICGANDCRFAVSLWGEMRLEHIVASGLEGTEALNDLIVHLFIPMSNDATYAPSWVSCHKRCGYQVFEVIENQVIVLQ